MCVWVWSVRTNCDIIVMAPMTTGTSSSRATRSGRRSTRCQVGGWVRARRDAREFPLFLRDAGRVAERRTERSGARGGTRNVEKWGRVAERGT